jgi:uncharacterized protein (DUF1499 family)
VYTASAIVLLAVVTGVVLLFLVSFMAPRPSNLGAHDGRLAGCPDSPNCVSTQAEDHDHWIAPLTYLGDESVVVETLVRIVEQLPRTRVISRTHDYLYVEFRSALFRFVDDVEFFVEAESGRVHLRSASRVGHSDLGVNRERIELIRRLFQASQSARTAEPGVHDSPVQSNSAR